MNFMIQWIQNNDKFIVHYEFLLETSITRVNFTRDEKLKKTAPRVLQPYAGFLRTKAVSHKKVRQVQINLALCAQTSL